MPTVKELVSKLNDEPKAAHKAYRELEILVTRASEPARAGERAAVATELAGQLNAKTPATKDADGKDVAAKLVHPAEPRRQVARLLGYVAGPKEVPALAEAMTDLDVRESARMAMDRVAGPEATAALVQALDNEVGPVFLVGAVNSLGKRRGAEAQAALRQATDNEDTEVRLAAVEALANFPDPGNDAFIAKASAGPGPAHQARAWKARLRLAETLAKAGRRPAARKIYEAIAAGDAPAPCRQAAVKAIKDLG